jgi:hypothetical protein
MEAAQHHKRFLAIVAVTLLVVTAGLGATFYALFGVQAGSADNRCTGAMKKQAIGAAMASPKLVIVAGSNAVNGLNAEMISSAIGMPVLNMGLFASLGPRLLLDEAKPILHRGDVVLIALEYNSYTFDQPTAPTVDFILGCNRAFFDGLSPAEKVRYVFSLDVQRVWDAVFNRVDASGEEGFEAPDVLTRFGDKRLDARFFPPLSQEQKDRLALYQPEPIEFDPQADGVKAIREFVAWGKQNGIGVVATWPNTIYFPSYENAPGFTQIRHFYESIGVPVAGDPAISLFPASMFYDTQYHLDIEGIVTRTRMLIPPLRQALAAMKAGG